MDFSPAHRMWALDVGSARRRKQGATGDSRSQLHAFTTEGSLKPQKALSGYRRAPDECLSTPGWASGCASLAGVGCKWNWWPFFFTTASETKGTRFSRCERNGGRRKRDAKWDKDKTPRRWKSDLSRLLMIVGAVWVPFQSNQLRSKAVELLQSHAVLIRQKQPVNETWFKKIGWNGWRVDAAWTDRHLIIPLLSFAHHLCNPLLPFFVLSS